MLATLEIERSRQAQLFNESSRGEIEAVQRNAVAHLSFDWHGESVIDGLESAVKADCAGYTILGSEALQRKGIAHRVGMINGHATTTVQIEGAVWLMDNLSPHLNQSLEGNQFGETELPGGRLSAVIDGDLLASNAGLNPINAYVKHPWLEAKRKKARDQWSSVGTNYLLISTFEPELGREMIKNHAQFREAYCAERIEDAAQFVVKMAGRFPEIDIRQDDAKKVKSLVRRLSAKRNFDIAQETTEAFFSSFQDIKDSRVVEYKADCLRYIAKYSGQRRLARIAIDLYQLAIQKPKSYDSSISAKIRLCNGLASEGVAI